MSLLGYYCIICGKKLKKGDSVIKLSDFQVYHPDCYKKDREEAYENIGKLDQQFLGEVRSHLDAFKTLVESESISDSKSFYGIWGKQLFSIDLLGAVIAEAEMFGSLGFLKKIQLKRQLSKQRNTLIEIGTLYREDYGAIQIERHMKELFPSTGEPTLEQLKDEEKKALAILKEQNVELCNALETLYSDIKEVSKETAYKTREEMKRQIQQIPKRVESL